MRTANGKESGGTARTHEQFGYAYDKAWNLNYRINNALVQTFGVNSLNELTTLSRDGNVTVAGAVSTTPTSVTVKDNANSAQDATFYTDNTFARTNVYVGVLAEDFQNLGYPEIFATWLGYRLAARSSP